ncbi:MAG: DUF1361 domain-containing protein [Patescibacteria group bacterium]
MEVFLYNFNFLLFNLSLAFIALLFGYLMLRVKSNVFKTLYGFIWFIFLPNTIYILTDFSHLYEDWSKVDLIFKLVLITQYAIFAILGALTFIYAVYFFERLLERKNKKGRKPTAFLIILILNFIVGFGVILGGVQRTNSWDVLVNPVRVINDSFGILNSPYLLKLSILSGVLFNTIYFYFVKPVTKWGKKK